MLTENLPHKTRKLQKVRRHFLPKTTTPDEQPLSIDPATKYLAPNHPYMLNVSLGLVEINRKICFSPELLNQHFKISGFVPEDKVPTKAITLLLSESKDSTHTPLDYTIRRLESYGDLELATWAHRIVKYHSRFPDLMGKFEDLFHSDDPIVDYNVRNMRTKAQKACQEIEGSYAYYKVLMVFNKTTSKRVSCSYSERFLQEMGYTIESFTSQVQECGLPPVFDADCQIYLQVAKAFLECALLSGNPIFEWPEYETTFYNKRGCREKALVQYISILEPNQGESLLHGYFILKTRPPTIGPHKGAQTEPDSRVTPCKRGLKCVKSEKGLEYDSESTEDEALEVVEKKQDSDGLCKIEKV